jgi:cytochrome b
MVVLAALAVIAVRVWWGTWHPNQRRARRRADAALRRMETR